MGKFSRISRYWPSAVVLTAVIALSLAPMPEVPDLGEVPLWDKWVHFVMYGGTCCVLWFDFFRNGHKASDFWRWAAWIVAMPTALGGLLEICQEYLTTCRSGEWMDFAADAVGVALALPIGLLIIRRWFSD